MAIRVKTGASTWSDVSKLRVKTAAGTWSDVIRGRVKTAASVWSDFFTSTVSPTIASRVTISRNNATYPSTLTGTNRHWTNSTSLTYVFQKSSDGTDWSDIGSPASIANPSSGSTNTKTYALTTEDMPAFTSYYRFVVTASNSTYSTSTTSASTSVSVLQPAPINSVAPTITPSLGSVGVTQYSVNSNGTWDPDDADGVYEYLWQSSDNPPTNTIFVSAPGTNNLSTYTPPSNFFTLGGFNSPIRCRVTATNPSGSTSAVSSNTAVVGPGIPTGGTITLSPSGTQYSGTLLTATTSGWSGSPTSYSVRIYGSTYNPPDTGNVQKASSSTASATYTITNGDATPPILYFKAFATAINSSGTSVEVESNVVTSKLPSASALATSDTTLTPGDPSSIVVANTVTTNQGNVTWTNGSNATSSWVSSVTPGSSFTGADGGTLLTSQLFDITSSATAVATVNNKNNIRKVGVSWTQDGALSYSASITISGSSIAGVNGTANVVGSTSGSSGSFEVNLSTGGGTVRVNSITVYTKASQTGGSFTFTPATAPSTTPTDKTSTATGSAAVYRAPANSVAPTITPTSGTAGLTEFSVNSNGTWSPDDADGIYTYQWQYFAGDPQNIPSATSSTYTPPPNYVSLYGTSLRCRVIATNLGGTGEAFSNVATVAALGAAFNPTFAATTSLTTSSFSGSVTNYSALYTWSFATSAGTVTPGSPSAGNYPFTVTGLTAGQSATVTVTTTRTGYADGSGTSTGSSKNAALTPTFGTNTSTIGGFTGSVTNFSTSYTWAISASNGGSVTFGTATGATRPFTVTGLTAGQSATVTVTTTRTGYADGTATSEPGTASVITPTGSVTVSGSLTLNSVLTCSVAGITNGVSYTYQWYYGTGGVADSYQMGATSSTLTLLSGDIPNQYFKCIVVATSATGTTATFVSNIVGPTYKAPGQVTGVTATVTSIGRPYNNGEIAVSWTAPANNGSAITGYYVESSSNGGSSWSVFSSNWTGGTGFGSSPWGVGTYIFRVSAINAAGTGAVSANSNNAVVTTVPQAPTIGTATAGDGTVSVSFTAGATGGSAITGFTVTSSSGNTGTGSSSPISVSDTNGTARTYTVTATNANGTSTASGASNSATPLLSVPAGGTVSISTNTGNYNIGSIITYSTTGWSGSPTSYSLRLYNGTNPVLTSDPLRASTTGASGTYTITSDDATKFFKAFATATNSAGTSTEASSTQVGPTPAPVVLVPANTSAPTTSGSLSVGSIVTFGVGSWSNSPTGYDLRLYRGTAGVLMTETVVAFAGSATTATYTITQADFNSGQLYLRAYASATNSGGTSAYAAGNEIGPITSASVPGIVTSLTATSALSGSNLNWSASWSAPSSNGGSAITGYKVYVERAGSQTGPWIASTTQIPAGSGAYTAGSPYSTASTSVSGRVTGTSATWIRVSVAAVNAVGTGSYTTAVG